jgi:hypothetical protein
MQAVAAVRYSGNVDLLKLVIGLEGITQVILAVRRQPENMQLFEAVIEQCLDSCVYSWMAISVHGVSIPPFQGWHGLIHNRKTSLSKDFQNLSIDPIPEAVLPVGVWGTPAEEPVNHLK